VRPYADRGRRSLAVHKNPTVLSARRARKDASVRIGLIAHHVAPIVPPFGGGVESFTWYLARWLAGRGHHVTMYAPPGSHVPGVELRTLELQPPLSRAARGDVSMPPEAFMAAHHAYMQAMLELAADGERYDLVHSNTLHYLPIAMAATLPVPLLTTLHTPPTPWLESALRQAARRVLPPLSAVSSTTRNAWAAVTPRITVVPNGIDTERWRPGPGGDGAVWTGRLVPEKAPHLAIDACRRGGLPLRLAGPITDPTYWSREIDPRLGGDVEYVGHLDHDELRTLIGGARVALVTPVWNEPFGLVAAEAMACGTPVAGFARGGLPELVGDAGGRLATEVDAAALVSAIEEASALDRVAVRRHAVQTAGIDAMGHGYERLYDSLVVEQPDAGATAPERVPTRRRRTLPVPVSATP